DGDRHQYPSSHHNGGFPDQDQSQSSVLFQHQQQPPGQAWSQEQRPASHNAEPGFTAQAFEDGFNEERNEPFALTAQTDDLHQENLNLEAVFQERRPQFSMKRRRSRAKSLPYRPVPEATKSSASHEDSSHAAPDNDGSVGRHLSAFRVIRGGEASAAFLRMTAEMVSKSYARAMGLPTPSQLRDRSRGPEPGSTASDMTEASRNTTSTPSSHSGRSWHGIPSLARGSVGKIMVWEDLEVMRLPRNREDRAQDGRHGITRYGKLNMWSLWS
ncbi:hypothetical protein MTO96_039688, partial [Rhipicephalus appendiculatus]